MNDFERHSAGAIITHKGIFSHLKSYQNEFELSKEFISKWVVPFYMNINKSDLNWIETISNLSTEITDEVILNNLGDFNWRTRKTGTFFATIKNKIEFADIIGTHLLKSEVCCVGNEYVIYFCSINNDKSSKYLKRYLDYYILHPELEFDQTAVITAIKYLDKKNRSNNFEKYKNKWKEMQISRNKILNERHQNLLNSNEIDKETKEKLSDIKYDKINVNLNFEYIENRIKTIQTIANKV